MAKEAKKENISGDTETIITAFALLLIYPLGVIIMWIITKWPRWMKILLTAPLIIFTLFIAAFIIFVAISWKNGNEESQKIQKISGICNDKCREVTYPDNAECFNKCTASYGIDYKRSYIPAVTDPTQLPSY